MYKVKYQMSHPTQQQSMSEACWLYMCLVQEIPKEIPESTLFAAMRVIPKPRLRCQTKTKLACRTARPSELCCTLHTCLSMHGATVDGDKDEREETTLSPWVTTITGPSPSPWH